VADTVERLVSLLHRSAEELDCVRYLEHCVEMARNPSTAQRQLDLLAETSDPREVVRRMADEARITKPREAPPGPHAVRRPIG
jgi:hypothetical protein